MKELFKALYTQVKAANTGITDLYLSVAPPSAVFPYAIMQLVSDVPDWGFVERYENILLQLNVYSADSTAESVCDIFKAITAELDFLDLPIDNYDSISFVRENGFLNRWNVDGTLIWDYMIQYRILLQTK